MKRHILFILTKTTVSLFFLSKKHSLSIVIIYSYEWSFVLRQNVGFVVVYRECLNDRFLLFAYLIYSWHALDDISYDIDSWAEVLLHISIAIFLTFLESHIVLIYSLALRASKETWGSSLTLQFNFLRLNVASGKKINDILHKIRCEKVSWDHVYHRL